MLGSDWSFGANSLKPRASAGRVRRAVSKWRMVAPSENDSTYRAVLLSPFSGSSRTGNAFGQSDPVVAPSNTNSSIASAFTHVTAKSFLFAQFVDAKEASMKLE